MRKLELKRICVALSALYLGLSHFPAYSQSQASVSLERSSGTATPYNDGTEGALDSPTDRIDAFKPPGLDASKPKLEFGTISRKGAGKNLSDQAPDQSTVKSTAQSTAPHDNWRKYYEAAIEDLDARRYDVAEDRLNSSLKAARLGMGDDEKLLLSRIALGKVYLAREKYADAEKLFTSCMGIAKHLKGANSIELAACEAGLAETALYNNKVIKAETYITDAIAVTNRLNQSSHEKARYLMTQASVLSKNNWIDQAEATAIDGIKMMREYPGTNSLDLADAYRQSALLFHEHGKSAEAQELFERSYKLIDEAARLNKTPQVEGQLVFRWEEGSPRSQEIPDADFPLKYMQVNNVRVAATIIDLWELYGVLISITNTGDERINIGAGKPQLFGAAGSSLHAHLEKLEIIDPGSIDRIRRERNMWDLTMNRPWLANMQKTRSQRGFVPKQGHDLFRGPNVFAVYGEWNALPRELPGKLLLEPSPERVQYQAEPKIDPGLVRSSTIKLRNLVPISLEPFESRTGELFFLNPRYEQLVLTVPIGNVLYQLPFSAKRKRIK